VSLFQHHPIFWYSLHLFVVAIKTAVSSGTSKAFQVLKYVFVARPASKTASTKHPKQAELEDGWVLVVEDIGNEKQDSDGIKVVNASDYHLGDEEEAKVCSLLFSIIMPYLYLRVADTM
jgi:hypothetical protein